MAIVEISPPILRVRITGFDKVLALRSELEIPLAHVRGVDVRPAEAHGWWHGFKVGSQIPGVVTAGSFYRWGDGWVFWDVHDPDRTIALHLEHERYTRLVLQVDDPDTVAQQVRQVLGP